MAIISMRRKLGTDRVKIVVCVAAISLVGGIAVKFGNRESLVQQPAKLAQVRTQASVQAPPAASARPATLPPPPRVVAPHEVSVSKATQIDALTRSGSAEDAYAAYKLVADCLRKRDLDYVQAISESDMPAEVKAALPKADAVCGDMTAAQLASAHLFIERAAKAGLPGAAAHMFDYAPDGRRTDEIWNEPAYATWRNETWELVLAAGRRGDQPALTVLQSAYENGMQGHDPGKALMYWTASMDAFAAEKKYPPERLERLNANAIQKFKDEGLNSDQIAAAIQAGHQFMQQH